MKLHRLSTTIIGSALVSLSLVAATASAEEFQAQQARSFDLGDTTAVVFYTVLGDGSYEVVTTAAVSDHPEIPAIRQVSTLESEQSISLTFASSVGSGPQPMLMISREGDSLNVMVNDTPVIASR